MKKNFKYYSPSDLNEFGIQGKFRFVSKTVEIDKSSNSLSNMSWSKNPENVIENVFLKVLVQGDYELLKYDAFDSEKFYLFKGGKVTQLISKKFLSNDLIKVNMSFRSQLSKLLTCGIENDNIAKTDYEEKDLIKIVSKHNQCSNPDTDYSYTFKTKSKIYFGFYIKGGISSKEIKINSYDFFNSEFYSTSFSNVTTNIATEFELVLPFSYNRFSVFVEPSFFSLSNENKDADNTERKIELSYLQINLGSRYYFKEHTNGFFVYGAFSFSKTLSGSFYEVNITGNSKVEFNPNISLPLKMGFGYLYKNKIYADFSYQTNAFLFSNSPNITNSTISSLGLQVGYKFL